jgi:hypothetical protein
MARFPRAFVPGVLRHRPVLQRPLSDRRRRRFHVQGRRRILAANLDG